MITLREYFLFDNMKHLKSLFILVVFSTTLSCSRKNGTSVTTVDVMVTDGASWTAASGATVYLYDSSNAVTSNLPKYTQTTDSKGDVKFTVVYSGQYYVVAQKVVAQKGNAKNYYNGLIPVGIFQSQTEIRNSPAQNPPAVVGGIKFRDTNGDGVVNASDNTPPPAVALTANTNNTFTTTIY
jgi:hypothetical protein